MRSVFVIVPWIWETKNNLHLLIVESVYICMCMCVCMYVNIDIFFAIPFNTNIPISIFFGIVFAYSVWYSLSHSSLTSFLCFILGIPFTDYR